MRSLIHRNISDSFLKLKLVLSLSILICLLPASGFARGSFDEFSAMTADECEAALSEMNFGTGFLGTGFTYKSQVRTTFQNALSAIMRVSGRATLKIRENNYRTVRGGENYIELLSFPSTNGEPTRAIRIEVTASTDAEPTSRLEANAIVLSVPRNFDFEALADGGRAIIQRLLRGHPLHPSITSAFGTIRTRELLGEPAVFLKAAQMESLQVIHASMNRGDPSITLVGPTGTGKTPIMGGMLAWRLENNRRNLIVVEVETAAQVSDAMAQARTLANPAPTFPYTVVRLGDGSDSTQNIDQVIADAEGSTAPRVLITTSSELRAQLARGKASLRATRTEKFQNLRNEFRFDGARAGLSPIDHLNRRVRQVSAKLHILANDQRAITKQLYDSMGALDPERTQYEWIRWGGKFGSTSIQELVATIERATKPVILITTIQSLRDRLNDLPVAESEAVLSRLRAMTNTFAFDEVHHLGAKTYRGVVDQIARHADSPAYFYGTTATPQHPEFQDFLQSISGGNAFWTHLDTAAAYLDPTEKNTINRNIDYVTTQYENAERNGDMVPFDEVTLYDTQPLDGSGQKFFISASRVDTTNRSNRKVINPYYDPFVVDLLRNKAAVRKKGIVIGSTIEEVKRIARKMEESYVRDGIIGLQNKKYRRFVALHSGLSQTEQEEILQDYEDGKIQYLVTVNMVNEGVDIPDATCTVNLTSSLNARGEIQKLGRVVRNALGKFSADYVGFFRTDDDENIDDENIFFITWINSSSFPARIKQNVRINSVTQTGVADTTVLDQLHSREMLKKLKGRLLLRTWQARRRSEAQARRNAEVAGSAPTVAPTPASVIQLQPPGSMASEGTTEETSQSNEITAAAYALREFFQERHAARNERLPARAGSDDDERKLFSSMDRLLRDPALADEFYNRVVNGDDADPEKLPAWAINRLDAFRRQLPTP